MKTVIVVGLSFLFSSCMHLGMMGTHGEGQTSEHQSASGPTLEKGVTTDNLEALATFPPLVLGKEVVFELRLEEKGNGLPVSGAAVSFRAVPIDKESRVQTHDTHATDGELDPDAVNFEQAIQETSQPGIYVAAFTPARWGEYELMFRVSAIGDEPLVPELVLSATKSVPSGNMGHGGGMMHGMNSTTEHLIVGGALMGVMMIAMWTSRGHMF